VSVEENEVIARRFVEELWNKGDLAVADELLAPDFTFNYPLPGATPDREGYKKTLSAYRAAFHDLHITIEDIVAEGDKEVGALRDAKSQGLDLEVSKEGSRSEKVRRIPRSQICYA